MVKYLLKKSYLRKSFKEVNFKDLWNSNGVFTTMWIYGKPQKILFFKSHVNNLINSLKVYKIYNKGIKKKIIGICLGYQQILYNEGGRIIQQKRIFHGFQSKIKVTKDSKLFKNNKIFEVGRYHSLRLEEPFYSENIKITMRCSKTNIAMGIEDHKNKVFGFQFHPESFLTKNGKVIIKKILSA